MLAGLALVALAFTLFANRTGLAANAVGWPLLSFGFGLLVLSASAWRLQVPGTGWLAAVSYSLYLSHKLAMHAVATWIAPALPLHGLALFPVYAAVIMAAGAALHYLVEKPGLALRERLSAPATATALPTMP
jgi:peptidoglycan/LPS O-acetylase OafA/YrhL